MIARPCLRNLDKPIVALWGLEPVDLAGVLGGVAVLYLFTHIGVALVGGGIACLALKALKAGKPRGYVFYLFYRSGILRAAPEGLRPPYLVLPPGPARRSLTFSAAPGREDDRSAEGEYFRGGRRYFT